MARTTIDDVLAAAQARLARVGPEDVSAAQRSGALVVDTRSSDARRETGVGPGSVHIPLSVLEWRLDPDADPAFRNGHATGLDQHVVLVCAHGFSSSLAACRLQDLGFIRATDLEGGFEAWRTAGLPVVPAPPDPDVPGMGDPAPS